MYLKWIFYGYLNQKRWVQEGVPPRKSDTGKMVTADKEKAEVLKKFLPQPVLMSAQHSTQPSKYWFTVRGLEKKHPSRCKQRSGSGSPEESEHPQDYESWWDASQSPDGIGWCSCQASNILEKPCQSTECPGYWEKDNITPIFKKVKRTTPETSNLSVSLVCQRRLWNRSFQKIC